MQVLLELQLKYFFYSYNLSIQIFLKVNSVNFQFSKIFQVPVRRSVSKSQPLQNANLDDQQKKRAVLTYRQCGLQSRVHRDFLRTQELFKNPKNLSKEALFGKNETPKKLRSKYFKCSDYLVHIMTLAWSQSYKTMLVLKKS